MAIEAPLSKCRPKRQIVRSRLNSLVLLYLYPKVILRNGGTAYHAKKTPAWPRKLGKRAQDRVKRWARRHGRNTLTVALILLIFFLAVWYTTPFVLRDFLNKKGEGLPDYHLHIGWVQISPWNCSVDVENVRLAKTGTEVPFFICPRVHVAMQWSEIFHFTLRSRIALISPIISFVSGPTAESSQLILPPQWVDTVKKLVPLRINQFTISDGVIHYYDFHADPKIDLVMDQIELSLDNLTNSAGSKSLMPSTAIMTARPFKTGVFAANIALNVDLKQPTFAEKIKLESVSAPALNPFLAKFGKVYAKSGTIAFYSEMVSAKGNYNGYAKPFFRNLKFEALPKDHSGLAALWASLVNGVKDVLENQEDAVATTVPITGHYTDPTIDFWSAIFGLLSNAFLQALAQGFESPEIAPAPAQQQVNPEAIPIHP